MNDYRNRRGQALSMQWVAYLLQNTYIDTCLGGDVTRSLLSHSMKGVAKKDLRPLGTGCVYVTNFILPLTIELALKALILQEGAKPLKVHNLTRLYNQLSTETVKRLEEEFYNLKENKTNTSGHLKILLKEHENDFEGWRYLDHPTLLKRDEIDLQISIIAILNLCND
jgi:hypothetical protein